jgi:hypothetical protein
MQREYNRFVLAAASLAGEGMTTGRGKDLYRLRRQIGKSVQTAEDAV